MGYLKEFYSNLLNKIETDSELLYNIVIGNTSADLDSICSSIAYAIYLSVTNSPSDPNKKFPEKKSIHIPVVNCSRRELELKIPFKLWTSFFPEKIGNEELQLICIDDYIISKILSKINDKSDESVFISLVDHNILDIKQIEWKSKVRRIIDHHQDNNETQAVERISPGPLVGSCSSLVTQLWSNLQNFEIDTSVALLLLGPIIKDTRCISKDLYNKRWNKIDEESFNFLIKKLHLNYQDCLKYLELLYSESNNSKLILSLDISDILTMDYKCFSYYTSSYDIMVGYSSFEIKLVDIIDHFGYQQFLTKCVSLLLYSIKL
ncbi:DHH family protein [Cryptosporidium muris RN66]|uniref:DHH family protein n=1 Tax=Cryptosporidium muris (strain RN66) TaxID=441375 RepID=B6A9D9_CRYMR|nr:DHH family protein [Cryptosporidium muris RN66]EEA04830.1 DHH family protein [Cryptosporidium muris RN66]|eukprot:XP_002139179.1 DHH family protein [Cryptosporidium muris RN66]